LFYTEVKLDLFL